MSTAFALLQGPAPEEDRRDSPETNPFPLDVMFWAFFALNVHRPRPQNSNPRRKRPKSGCTPLACEARTDAVFVGGPSELGVSNMETRAIHVYAVRADGSVVTHQTRQHKPAEIFKIYPRGTAVLRLFASASESVGQDWPLDCAGIPRLRGMVVVIAIDVTGKWTRHVFRIPSNMREPWKVQGRTN